MQIKEQAAANLAKLPELCYAMAACNPPGSRIVAIRAGKQGSFPTEFDLPVLTLKEVREVIDRLNFRLGVTPQQKEAMLAGSLFGWHVPRANPEQYVPH